MLKITTLAISLAMAAAFSMPSQGGEPSCSTDPSCGACPSGTCCPQCGCHEGLVPVCHQYWEKKKVTEYCYKCVCKEICLPGRCGAVNDGLFGDHCDCKEGCGCQENCGCKENCGCNNGECCNCKFREVHTLVKCPVTKEVCVRKCRIDWVCPHCGCGCGCDASVAPGGAPTAAPLPPAPPAPPTAGKTTATDLAPAATASAY